MHIPDSAIGPATSIVTGAAMLPVWYAAGLRLRETLASRRVPLLALGSAFCFTLMMFNIPVPGGTTVHVTGAVLLAVLLGPWAAAIGVTVTLVIQAFFFADGGVFALGANCFTMAFAMPFGGYAVYRLVAGGSGEGSRRRAVAAAAGGFVGINLAALLTAILLGIQPGLHHDAAGHALYFPFGLAVTVPAMMVAHLTIAGLGEAAVTALAVRYLQTAAIPLADAVEPGRARPRSATAWLGVALGVLVALTPLGWLASGSAWGEWSTEELAARAGYVPARLASVEERGFKGLDLLPDYLSDRGPLAYVFAGAVGVVLALAPLLLAGWLVSRRKGTDAGPPAGGSPTGFTGGLPDWMRSAGSEKSRTGPGKRGRDFVERTLADLSETARSSLLAEASARRDGLLQRLDARVKILGLLGFVVLTSFLRDPIVLLGLLAGATALAALSRIPVAGFHGRVWLSVPLAVGAVTLPAALSAVTPGPALLVLLDRPYLALTRPGLALSAILTLRVGVAIAFVTLLTLSTPWNELMGGLRILLVPKRFLMVLTLAYRYLGVLTQAATDLFTARKSRTVGRPARSEGRGFLGGAAGALFGKTLQLADEVHAAMLSRGFSGEPRPLRLARIRAADLLWLAGMTVLAVVAAGASFLG